MKERVSLVEAAKQANLSRDKAKYWLELLGCCLIKEKRKSFVPLGAVVLLEAMRLSTETGLTPSAAAEHVKLTYSERQIPEEPVKELQNPKDTMAEMTARIEGLEKAVLLLVEENRALNQKVGKLLLEDTRTSAALLREPPKIIKAWEPKAAHDPLDGMTWYQRIWVEVFEPWKMRKCNS